MSLGWWTDLEVARRSGAQVRQRGDGYVVRTPDNPGYYWGNYLLVPADRPADDCRRQFREEFPQAKHVAIGLLGAPAPAHWEPWPVESTEVLARTSPPQAPAVSGYTVRALRDDDWRQAWRNEVTEQTQAYADFAWRRIEARKRMVGQGDGLFVGAFQGEDLVADLGVVLCGSVARYQSVLTRPDHRGRGLASWLLARAGLWAQQRGANRWVIIADPGSAAQRLYAGLGFQWVESSHQVERID